MRRLLRGSRLAAVALLVACGEPKPALELRILDAATGRPTPARVELVDDIGRSYVARDALPVAGDCGRRPIHNWIGWWARIQMRRALMREIPNPYTGTTNFYAGGNARVELPPADYRLRIFKGNEFLVANRRFTITSSGSLSLTVPLERWSDPGAEGWFSADDHLHIARPHPEFDRLIGRWMQAEDLDVANLLQMGLARGIHITPQYGFGPAAAYHFDDTLVASGQENPRTHVLGHAITLGASEWLDQADDYLAYDRIWRRARQSGGINGYAHWGLGGADEGLAVWAPERLLDFLEVLGFGLAYYPMWYDLLNLGLEITPTAGSDYPCGPGLPGRERFYARVEGPLTYRDWIAAVRNGRTFVTNGPILDLEVGGSGIGDRLALAEPTQVRVRARVRFDPARDEVTALELVQAGRIVARQTTGGPGVIRLDTVVPVDRTTWVAARATGRKIDETPVGGMQFLAQALTYLPRRSAERLLAGSELPRNGDPRPTAAHTAPVRITVAGTPALEAQPSAAVAARRLLALLAELEQRFADERLHEMASYPGRGDGVRALDLERGRPALLAAIARARRCYEPIARGEHLTAPCKSEKRTPGPRRGREG